MSVIFYFSHTYRANLCSYTLIVQCDIPYLFLRILIEDEVLFKLLVEFYPIINRCNKKIGSSSCALKKGKKI